MTKLIDAVKANELSVVKELLILDADIDVNAQNEDQETALHIAVYARFDRIVYELLKHPDIDPNIKNRYGATPLLLAFNNGRYPTDEDVNIAQQLVAFPKVDVNALDLNRLSALYLACYHGHLDHVLAILKRPDIDVNQTDDEGNTALHVCIFHDPHDIGGCMDVEPGGDKAREKLPQIQMAKTILAINPDLINVKNNEGQTLLHICARHGEWELATVLLRYPNIDVNSIDCDSKTPLHYSYQHNMEKTTHILLNHFDIDSSIEDNQGKKPLDYFKPKRKFSQSDFFKAPAVTSPVDERADSPSLCAKAIGGLFGRFV